MTVASSVATPAAPSRSSALRRHLNLTLELAVTSFRLKYTGSVLGYAWSLLKPLFIFGMTYAVFVRVLHSGGGDDSFPRQLLLGIVIWTFFADATTSSISSIVGNGHMIRKAWFPRWIPMLASTLSAAMTLAVNMALLIVIGVPLGFYTVGLQTLVLPLLFIELYVLVLGIGLLTSSLFVSFRDLGHLWDVALQLLFYGSGVIFSLSVIPKSFTRLVVANPMGQIIEDMRRSIVSTRIPWSEQVLGPWTFAPFLIVAVLVVIGALTFRHLEPRFGERL